MIEAYYLSMNKPKSAPQGNNKIISIISKLIDCVKTSAGNLISYLQTGDKIVKKL